MEISSKVSGSNCADSENTVFVVEEKCVYPVAQLDECVWHIFREHNLVADHLAKLGKDGQRKITIEGVKRTQRIGKQFVAIWMVAEELTAVAGVTL